MRNWKTTLVGLILASLVAVQPLFEAGEYDWKRLGYAALIAAFGYLTKDAGVSGTGK